MNREDAFLGLCEVIAAYQQDPAHVGEPLRLVTADEIANWAIVWKMRGEVQEQEKQQRCEAEALVVRKPSRRYYYAEGLDSGDSGDTTRAVDDARTEVADPMFANLVGSLCTDGLHRPVIDIDFPCELHPSTTSGHFHLYIDVPLAESTYMQLLKALADSGIVQRFYAEAAQIRGQTFVRPPWVKKPPKREKNEQPNELSVVVDTEGESQAF